MTHRRVLVLALVVCAGLAACGWNPSRPFERDSPAVNEALADLDAGDAGSATAKLEDYLSTGTCKEGSIGTPDLLKRRSDGTFDLGLSLFRVAERFGRRFGEEEVDAGGDDGMRSRRHGQTECARRVVEAIADDPSVTLELRARARYLAGNLGFLDGDYEGAVHAYDRALVLTPAVVDGGDSVGRDAAWNRAIALARIEDKRDAGQDAAQDASQDGSQDGAKPDAGHDAASEAGKGSGGQDGSTPEAGDGNDGGDDEAGSQPPHPPDAGSEPEAGQPAPPSVNEDDRMLDQLENAPTLQQEEAKRSSKKHVRGMADK